MKNKIYLWLIVSMTLIMSVSLVIFASLQTNSKLPINVDPEKINVYYRSQSETLSYTESDSEYVEILKMYNNAFKKSYLNQITTNQFLGEGIDEATSQSGWDDQDKVKGLYLEFKYEKNQRLVISRNGNTRQVFISSIIFELTQEKEVHKIYIHYAQDGKYNNKEASDGVEVYPLTTEGDTKELYVYLRGLINEKKDS
jgi:hypothetical protein